MRNTALVTGLAVGVLGIGAASAGAVPITIDLSTSSVTAGSLDPSSETLTAGRLTGELNTENFSAAFPDGNTLPTVRIPRVTIPALLPLLPPVYDGPVTITTTAKAFSGRARATGSDISFDLTGTVSYSLTADDLPAGENTCTTQDVPLALTGQPLNLATGDYTASGRSTGALVTGAGTFCAALVTRASGSYPTAVAGKLTIPGVIPLPTVTTVTLPPTTPAPAPAPTPAPAPPPAAAVKVGRLAVSVSRPRTVRRGRSSVTKVVVRNTGAGSARSVSVKLAAGKRVSPRSVTKRYAVIGVGKTRTFSVRLRTTKRTAKRTTLQVTATGASGLSATKRTTLRLR